MFAILKLLLLMLRMELLKEVNVAAIENPSFHSRRQNEEGFVNFPSGVPFDDVAFPDSIVKSAECTIRLSKSFVHF